MESRSPTLQADSLPAEPQGKPWETKERAISLPDQSFWLRSIPLQKSESPGLLLVPWVHGFHDPHICSHKNPPPPTTPPHPQPDPISYDSQLLHKLSLHLVSSPDSLSGSTPNTSYRKPSQTFPLRLLPRFPSKTLIWSPRVGHGCKYPPNDLGVSLRQ